jgi:hypothetical protein
MRTNAQRKKRIERGFRIRTYRPLLSYPRTKKPAGAGLAGRWVMIDDDMGRRLAICAVIGIAPSLVLAIGEEPRGLARLDEAIEASLSLGLGGDPVVEPEAPRA